ncbi:hypothetical protein A2U01_0106038, partial [Trifolium medium]|nr:hypothetical protein [Trifolium medium]
EIVHLIRSFSAQGKYLPDHSPGLLTLGTLMNFFSVVKANYLLPTDIDPMP